MIGKNNEEDAFNIHEEASDMTFKEAMKKHAIGEEPSEDILDAALHDANADNVNIVSSVNNDDDTPNDKEPVTGDLNGDMVYVDNAGIAAKKKATKQRNIFIVVVVGVLLVVGVLVGLNIYNALNNNVKSGNQYASSANKSDTNTSTDTIAKNITDYMENDIRKVDYYATSKSAQTKEQKEEADADALASAPVNAAAGIAGAPDDTNDQDKVYNEDGSLNDNFTYITQDDITTTVRDDIERLINPVYGEWSSLQNPDRMDWTQGADKAHLDVNSWNRLADMFTYDNRNMLKNDNESDARSVVPLYADWDKNQYGGEWTNRLMYEPIVGKLLSYNCNYYIQSVEGDHITCTANIGYQGKVDTGEDLRKKHTIIKSVKKTMTINYLVNYHDSESDRHILIDSIQQN